MFIDKDLTLIERKIQKKDNTKGWQIQTDEEGKFKEEREVEKSNVNDNVLRIVIGNMTKNFGGTK